MTDPIADFLTRIRNAITASHETVEIPSSRLKEIARILPEQGYIEGFDVEPPEPPAPGELIRIRLRYTEERQLGDLRPAARLAARPPHLRRRQAHPQGPGRHGHRRSSRPPTAS